jgi:iron-sulfur cluster assembly protein
MNVTITPAAEGFMRRMVRMSGGRGGFRLTMTPGGCSGLSATFSVEPEAAPDDGVVERDGLRVFLSAASVPLLDGVTVDFSDSPTGTGFVFRDPKAGACSCSSSGVAAVSVAAIKRRV